MMKSEGGAKSEKWERDLGEREKLRWWRRVVVENITNNKGNVTPVKLYYNQGISSTTTTAPYHHHHRRRRRRCVSARKLAAALWELHHYDLQMHHAAAASLPRLRRTNHHQSGGAAHPLDPSPPPPDLQPGSSSSLRRHVAASLMQHHRTADRSSHHHHALQLLSPASYGSSMEITPYNPAVTTTSSLNCGLRTSTELLKVLNRIWTLEEQHVSNTSLIKSLKKELDSARSQVKSLVREQQADRKQMDEFAKHITEGNFHRKNKEQDRINSTRDELESERKLRKRSESLHRKLARELHDVKATLADVTRELESERSSRGILESLCDEFALGIRGYEKEMHACRKNSDKDWSEEGNLILHVSESWLDERMQMNLQTVGGDKESVVQRLRPEIEAFLNAKKGNSTNKTFRRSSLESIPLNTIVSGPYEEGDEDGSTVGDSNCFELEKANENRKTENAETIKQCRGKKKAGLAKGSSPSGLQGKFEEHMSEAMRNTQDADGETNGPTELGGTSVRVNSNYVIENLIRNHYLLSENGKNKEGGDAEYGSASSVWRGQPSPVRKWTEKLPSHQPELHEATESTSVKEKNSLKAKLFEARMRGGRRLHTHSKGSIIPSKNEVLVMVPVDSGPIISDCKSFFGLLQHAKVKSSKYLKSHPLPCV